MGQYSVHEAKTNLSKLIASALAGEDVVIARGSLPVCAAGGSCDTSAALLWGAERQDRDGRTL
jgi:hypothetical protein